MLCIWRGYCLNNMGNTHGQLNRHFPAGENSGNKEGCKKLSTGRFWKILFVDTVLCIFLSSKKGRIFQKLRISPFVLFFSFLSLVFVFLFQGGSDEYHCEGLERMNSDRSLLSSPAAKRNSERAGLPHAGPPRFV